MVGRIVEIVEDSRHLHAYRGFMVVENTDDSRKELGRIPLDDIAAVIVSAHIVRLKNKAHGTVKSIGCVSKKRTCRIPLG